MSEVRFLLDENLPSALERALLRREPTLDVSRVGQKGAPPLGTGDSELLLVCEADRMLLVTRDRSTMPRHVTEHLHSGHHTHGVFLIKRNSSLSEIIEDLILVWSSSGSEEWRDQLLYLPLQAG
jgi:hypothetical protein|tara:strand:+ start:380 stop:751 length:372 start_codon:yes stop_codon:yes gene_type:complete